MVKRKAITSLDEWLKEGEAALEVSRTSTKNCSRDRVVPALSTAEGVQSGVTTEPSTKASATVVTPNEVAASGDVAASRSVTAPGSGVITKDVAANWFWDLLAQSCYERW